MKKLLSVLMLGLRMGAVSYPILFNEAKAQSAPKAKYVFECPIGNLPPSLTWKIAKKGVNCYAIGGGCTVVHCDDGPVQTPEQ